MRMEDPSNQIKCMGRATKRGEGSLREIYPAFG